MLITAKNLIGRTIGAVDGEIGEARDLYFDDRSWTVRYFVVETSPWFDSRRTIIATACFRSKNWHTNVIPVDLTREQVRRSPDSGAVRPVSRQQEAQIVQYYGWPSYWHLETMYTKPLVGAESEPAPPQGEEPRLRSVQEVLGYAVRGPDGAIGKIADFIVDDACWEIRYAVADTGGWLPGKKVLLLPQWIEEISWNDAEVHIGMSRGVVRNAPAYDPSLPLTKGDEERFDDYFRVSGSRRRNSAG